MGSLSEETDVQDSITLTLNRFPFHIHRGHVRGIGDASHFTPRGSERPPGPKELPGGGITSVDALWVGLPVLSILGDKPGARLGATLCNAAGIPEMVMPDLASYVERAVALANDGDEREALRQRLLDGRDSQPLFDNARYGRNLDNAIAAAWHNHLAGRPPERIELGE